MADRTDRAVPSWAAGIVSALSRDRPAVVTTAVIGDYLKDLGPDRNAGQVASDLQQLGWLSSLHVKGAWAFVPAGEARPNDPYLDLRGWQAREPDAVFALAGEAACWHLGYLPRRFDGQVAVWLPKGERLAHGLRAHVRVVRIGWDAHEVRRLRPTTKLLRSKGLDLINWASGLPALGPEALTVQLASRPSSFRAWADLVSQLDALAGDSDPGRVVDLLEGQSASVWQRAAYLLDRGGQHDHARRVIDARPAVPMPVVHFGDGPDAVWSSEFQVNDHLVAPVQQKLGKA
jgi:hypothetical protein